MVRLQRAMSGLWFVASTKYVLYGPRYSQTGVWELREANVGSDNTWLADVGLDGATAPTRRKLVEALRHADEQSPMPTIDDEYRQIRLVRVGVGYQDESGTFSLERARAANGKLYWWLTAGRDLPGHHWNKSSIALRSIRARIADYLEMCERHGWDPATVCAEDDPTGLALT